MKIKSIAAAGAIGLGMGFAGLFVGAGTASADQCGALPTGFTPANIACVTNANVSEFLRTTSPQYNVDVFLNGQNETAGDPATNNGLGILDQPQTFVDSVGTFLEWTDGSGSSA